MTFRFLTSGESHGKCLNAIIDGIPAGFPLDFDFIDNELSSRQSGYGRGARQKIEHDKAAFNSGIRHGVTLGTPICIEIQNKDWKNWQEIMSIYKIDEKQTGGKNSEKNAKNGAVAEKILLPRPGHADLAGLIKFNQDDIRNILERSSARETAIRTAVGALSQCILKQFKIRGSARVLSIGGKKNEAEIKKIIDETKMAGDTLGGEIEVRFKNLPIGLGTFAHFDRRLDGIIAKYVMSVPAIKSVEIGLGKGYADKLGSACHDEIFYENGEFTRHTNNAGGLEGGMTNGEEIIVRATMKPIPTMKKPLKSVNIKTKKANDAHFERSDVEAVEACSVVCKNMVAIAILEAFLDKFAGDSFKEIKKNYEKK